MLLAIELGLGIGGENKEEILRPAVALFTYKLPSSPYALHRGHELPARTRKGRGKR